MLFIKIKMAGTSPVVQWLGLCFQLRGGWEGMDSIPGPGTKIPYTTYMAEKDFKSI